MFAVIGRWRMDPEIALAQREALDGIVAGVSQLPDLVKGYWTTATAGACRTPSSSVADRR